MLGSQGVRSRMPAFASRLMGCARPYIIVVGEGFAIGLHGLNLGSL